MTGIADCQSLLDSKCSFVPGKGVARSAEAIGPRQLEEAVSGGPAEDVILTVIYLSERDQICTTYHQMQFYTHSSSSIHNAMPLKTIFSHF